MYSDIYPFALGTCSHTVPQVLIIHKETLSKQDRDKPLHQLDFLQSPAVEEADIVVITDDIHIKVIKNRYGSVQYGDVSDLAAILLKYMPVSR